MNYNKSILITLGHNSSVIFYNCEGKPLGYEQERLSGIKSDSSYPKLALEKVLSHLSEEEITGSNVFVSHWFDTFNLFEINNKYFDSMHFAVLVEKYNLNVIPLSPSFTHHDAHAWSTLAFSENFVDLADGDIHHIVLDGFGNNQEVLSIYKSSDTGLEPVLKTYGYKNSLGLLYQYATSFCKMKENQDEYKFLGYEANIDSMIGPEAIEGLRILAYDFSMKFMENIKEANIKPEKGEDLIDYVALGGVKQDVYIHLQTVLDAFRENDFLDNIEETRTIIGFYVQQCLENCILRLISKFKIKNVFLSGGCFMNVKLNKVILDNIQGKVCVNPLTGDQGAAIGMFRRYTNTKFDFYDLCFGKRDKMESIHASTKIGLADEGIIILHKNWEFYGFVAELITDNFIVNVIQGDMEFGARALCNTSTLAKPTLDNTRYINMVNKRNEIMPMAPVMLATEMHLMLKPYDVHRVIGSNEYMIMTHDYIRPVAMNNDYYRGVLHTKVCEKGYTCRPQIIYNKTSNIGEILQRVNPTCLINTSFNTHGRPILFSVEDAIEDFRKQKKLDVDNRLMLVILSNND